MEAISGFGGSVAAVNTTYSQTLSIDAQIPANAPLPIPTTPQAAFAQSSVSQDTFTASQAAQALLASTAVTTAPATSPATTNQTATSTDTTAIQSNAAAQQNAAAPSQAQTPAIAVTAQNTVSQPPAISQSAVQEFDADQAPPPYTISTVTSADQRATNSIVKPLNSYQVKQFSSFLATLRSITSSVLPQFSFSA